ncbi:MAG: carboxypeptidase regulatory-like domain-containing protein [Acidobacteria bacterium]|nr:carboxypeptidase regulatory-like domain-containing protein [Acidobacteriota bacterium]
MRKAALIVAITLGCLMVSHAQTLHFPTMVRGHVYDRNGKELQDVTIVAEDQSGKQWKVTGPNVFYNGDHYYNLSLPFGVYKITATKELFDPFVVPVFPTIKSEGVLKLDFVMICRSCPDGLPDLRKQLPQSKNPSPTRPQLH